MSWRVDFWDHANSSGSCVGNHTFDVSLGVYSVQTAELAEFGHSGNLHREAILVYDVPMQDIHLHVKHAID